MLTSSLGRRGGMTAPHRAAALAGRDILKLGGTAIEAMVAAAATIAVTYPHMNGIGGDGFWIIHRPNQAPIGISGCGQAADLATPEFFQRHDFRASLPTRGGLAALTVPGTIAGWSKALELVPEPQQLPLSTLLADAISYAEEGIAVTQNQAFCTESKLDGLRNVPGFAETYLFDGNPPKPGALLRQAALGQTLKHLSLHGLHSFYEGPLADAHADFLEAHGSPLRVDDFRLFRAECVEPLTLTTSHGQLFNMVAPTQGVSSLSILGIVRRQIIWDSRAFSDWRLWLIL